MDTKEPAAPAAEGSAGWKTAALLACIVVLAALLRGWALSARGALDYDECYYYILGRNLVTGNGYTLNGLSHTAFPPLYPLLVGLASLLVSTIRDATCSVSLAAGALLPVPVYFLGRELFSRRAGLLSAAFVAAWPALFFYAIRSVVYRNRLYAGSEPLFLTLFAAGLLFLVLAARRGRRHHAGLGGLFFGLSALTRNEGVVLFAFVFVALAVWLLAGRDPRGRAAWLLSLAAAGLLVALSPFLFYVHSVAGAWGMGSKVGNFARIRPTLWSWIEEGDAEGYMNVHYRLSDDATRMKDDYWGIRREEGARSGDVGGLTEAISLVADPQWRWLKAFGRVFVDSRVPLVPVYMWPLVLLGVVLAGFTSGGRLFLSFLVAVLAAQLLLAVTIYVLARFELPLLLLLVIASAEGLSRIAGFDVRSLTGAPARADGGGSKAGRGGPAADLESQVISRSAVAGGGPEVVGTILARATERAGLDLRTVTLWAAALVALLVCSISGILYNEAGNREGRVAGAVSSTEVDRETARQLRREIPEGATMMCNKPWIALWAGARWRVSPHDTPERILKYALANDIDYALLGSWQLPPPGEGGPLGPYFVKSFGEGGGPYLFDFTGARGG